VLVEFRNVVFIVLRCLKGRVWVFGPSRGLERQVHICLPLRVEYSVVALAMRVKLLFLALAMRVGSSVLALVLRIGFSVLAFALIVVSSVLALALRTGFLILSLAFQVESSVSLVLGLSLENWLLVNICDCSVWQKGLPQHAVCRSSVNFVFVRGFTAISCCTAPSLLWHDKADLGSHDRHCTHCVHLGCDTQHGAGVCQSFNAVIFASVSLWTDLCL